MGLFVLKKDESEVKRQRRWGTPRGALREVDVVPTVARQRLLGS